MNIASRIWQREAHDRTGEPFVMMIDASCRDRKIPGTILIRNDNRTMSAVVLSSTLQRADSQLHAGCITLLLADERGESPSATRHTIRRQERARLVLQKERTMIVSNPRGRDDSPSTPPRSVAGPVVRYGTRRHARCCIGWAKPAARVML